MLGEHGRMEDGKVVQHMRRKYTGDVAQKVDVICYEVELAIAEAGRSESFGSYGAVPPAHRQSVWAADRKDEVGGCCRSNETLNEIVGGGDAVALNVDDDIEAVFQAPALAVRKASRGPIVFRPKESDGGESSEAKQFAKELRLVVTTGNAHEGELT